MAISPPSNPLVTVARTWCSPLEFVSQTLMSSWMCHFPTLVGQRGWIHCENNYSYVICGIIEGGGHSTSLWSSESPICLISELCLTPLLPLHWCHCKIFSLKWVPQLLAPEVWWLLWLLLPRDLPLGLWSVRPLLPPDYTEQLQLLLPDLVPFTILCIEYCSVDSLCVYQLCMYAESMAHCQSLYTSFLLTNAKNQPCQSLNGPNNISSYVKVMIHGEVIVMLSTYQNQLHSQSSDGAISVGSSTSEITW